LPLGAQRDYSLMPLWLGENNACLDLVITKIILRKLVAPIQYVPGDSVAAIIELVENEKSLLSGNIEHNH
jgi:hypothetical protein